MTASTPPCTENPVSAPATSYSQLSCQSCRARKQKCDRKVPECRRCNSRGVECAYPSSRKTHKARRKRVASLEVKLLQLQDRIRTLDPDGLSPQQPTQSVPCTPVSSLPNEPLSPTAQFVRGQSNPGTTNETHPESPQESPPRPPLSEANCNELVSPEVQEALTAIYFEKWYPAAPMMQRSRYVSSLALPTTSQPAACLQHAIMATGATTNPKFAALATPLYKRARALAEADDMEDKPGHTVTVAHAQCWLLISNIEAQNALFSRAFVSLGRSIRCAQMLNLHQLDRDKHEANLSSQYVPAKDWIELEERRRTWWIIYVNDRLTSATSGLPGAIDNRQIRTSLPVSEEAFESGEETPTITFMEALQPHMTINSPLAARVLAAYAYYQAADLNNQANEGDFDNAGSGENDDYWTKQHEIENQLLSLMLRLPKSVQLPRNSGCQYAVFVNILIHTATTVLHQTAIRSTLGHEGIDADYCRRQSRSRMLAAATQTLAVFQLTEDLLITTRNPIQDYAAYITALVFVQDFVIEGNTESKSNLSFLLKSLQTAGQHHPVCKMLAEQLAAEVERLGIEVPGGPAEVNLT